MGECSNWECSGWIPDDAPSLTLCGGCASNKILLDELDRRRAAEERAAHRAERTSFPCAWCSTPVNSPAKETLYEWLNSPLVGSGTPNGESLHRNEDGWMDAAYGERVLRRLLSQIFPPPPFPCCSMKHFSEGKSGGVDMKKVGDDVLVGARSLAGVLDSLDLATWKSKQIAAAEFREEQNEIAHSKKLLSQVRRLRMYVVICVCAGGWLGWIDWWDIFDSRAENVASGAAAMGLVGLFGLLKHRPSREQVQSARLILAQSAGMDAAVEPAESVAPTAAEAPVQPRAQQAPQVSRPAKPVQEKRVALAKPRLYMSAPAAEGWSTLDPSGQVDCPDCEISIKAKNLERHRQKTHPDSPPFVCVEAADDFVKCPACAHGQVKAKGFLRHWNKVHGA